MYSFYHQRTYKTFCSIFFKILILMHAFSICSNDTKAFSPYTCNNKITLIVEIPLPL